MPRRVRPCVIRGAPTQKLEFPVRTNMIPRQIPDQSWYMQSLFSVLIGGILPFGAVFIELFFILSSVWLNQVRHAHPWRRLHQFGPIPAYGVSGWRAQFYYVFGFLALVVLILVVTCSEISIVLVYFQLCSEVRDRRWSPRLGCATSPLASAISLCRSVRQA